MYYFFTGDGDGHVQSVVLSAFLMSVGFSLGIMAILAELISVNRQLLEKLAYRQQLIEGKLDKGRFKTVGSGERITANIRAEYPEKT